MYKVSGKNVFLSSLLIMSNHCIIWLVNHLQKLAERMKAVEKAQFRIDEEKGKWNKVLSLDFMSSEESGYEEEEEVLIHHLIPWISSTVKSFKRKLASLNGKSPQSKRQKKPRVDGPMSTRSKPNESEKFPS